MAEEEIALIHLVSPDRKFSITVVEDDPHYATFFSSIREIEGVLPNVIQVPSYVLEQHEAWLRLLRWVELSSIVFYQGGYTIEGKNPADLRLLAPPTVFLADVFIIIHHMLDPPVNWMRFVAVDERSSFQERSDYYRAVGRMVRSDPRMETHHTSGLWHDRLYKDFQLTRDPIRRRNQPESISTEAANLTPLSPQDYERLINVDYMNVLQGARHSALVQSIGRHDRILSGPEKGDIDWTLVIWSDIIALVDVQWTIKPTWDLSAPPLVKSKGGFTLPYAYAGERLLRAPTQLPVHETYFELGGSPGYISYSLRSHVNSSRPPIQFGVSHFNILYDRTMRALTNEEDVSIYDPVRLGLSVILTKGKYRDINRAGGKDKEVEIVPSKRAPNWAYEANIYSIIPLLHLTVLLQVPRSRVGVTAGYQNITLDEKYFPATIEVVKSTLGTRALAVFVSTLLHYVPEDKKALAFCELAISELGDGQGLFIKLPE